MYIGIKSGPSKSHIKRSATGQRHMLFLAVSKALTLQVLIE